MSLARDKDEKTLFQPAAPKPPEPDATARHRRARAGLPAGTLLNNIYGVRRFIARGGTGEVYEGINVNTDERVAIKVVLPHLAANPRIQAMFRKEARILTELAHPALVRYRVLAHEPDLELFYIVTEFIDGPSLARRLPELQPSAAELSDLIRRLAGGLEAAHALGAVHRDMSPDNVLLPQGRLDQAKIIDFGIARESGLEHQTLVGDSFAGKIGYVAPEQFGDFDRRIGPWTDVYSLGLVGLAVAGGRSPAMGVNLVDAVARRREGVDLSALPASLKPVFARMLAPDPADRFQTMAEVVAALDGRVDQPLGSDETAPTGDEGREPGSSRAWLIGAGFAAALAVAAAGLMLFAGRPHAPPVQAAVPAEAGRAEPVAAVPVEATPIAGEVAATAVPDRKPPAPVAKRPVVKPQAVVSPLSVAQAAPAPVVPVQVPSALAPAAPAAGPAVAQVAGAPSAPSAAVEACYSVVGGGWNYLGYAGRASCVAQAFAACEVVNGRWGKIQLRRYDGKIEARGGGLFSRWQSVAPSTCPPPPEAGR